MYTNTTHTLYQDVGTAAHRNTLATHLQQHCNTLVALMRTHTFSLATH
jgi:hypothetical protein